MSAGVGLAGPRGLRGRGQCQGQEGLEKPAFQHRLSSSVIGFADECLQLYKSIRKPGASLDGLYP